MAEAGAVEAVGTQGTGGTVHLLGDQVGLAGTAWIDVSGSAGGGVALIGGDYQGKNSAIQNASRTYFARDARVNADALTDGNGGKVIFWSDEVTRAFGTVSARGGARSGNGDSSRGR